MRRKSWRILRRCIAAVDAKFTGYLFNPRSEKGRAKGVAFTSRLGYNADNWEELRTEILNSVMRYPVKEKAEDQYGVKYEQKIVLYGLNGKPANIVVGWMYKNEKTWMTTAMIKEVGKGEED